jgi:hypothetical protein
MNADALSAMLPVGRFSAGKRDYEISVFVGNTTASQL